MSQLGIAEERYNEMMLQKMFCMFLKKLNENFGEFNIFKRKFDKSFKILIYGDLS